MRHLFFIILFLLSAISSLCAQVADSVKIEFITCSPGKEIYELEGHAGLRIYTPGGDDVILNWGLFDFNSDHFVYRFLKGETDYMVGAMPTLPFVNFYAAEGRSVHAFELNLTPEEKQKLLEAVSVNMLPENRVYRYNYVKDNCSTRPLQMIERAVGDTLTVALPAGYTLDSFREAMQFYHANYPWYQFGVDVALGKGIDTPATPRDLLFAPALADLMLPSATIGVRQIVSHSYYLAGGPENNAVEEPTPWYLAPLFWSIILLIATIALTIRDLHCVRISRWFDSIFYGAIFVASLLVTFLIFISSHEATSPNYQLLLFNPLTIIGAVGIWIKRAHSLVFCWQIVNFVALILLIFVWLTGFQYLNPAVIILTVTDLLRSSAYIFIKCCQNRKE